MSLFTLPSEIILHVLQNLSLRDLLPLQSVSRYFDSFIKNNEALYHGEAIRHNFASASMKLEDVIERLPGGWMDRLSGWRDLCRRFTLLERNWEGRGDAPRETLFRSTGNGVHRFKIDEEHRFIVNTHRKGGLKITDIDTDKTLFEIHPIYVRHYAHCEYGNGYLIFDRLRPHSLEIWRLESSNWDGRPITSSQYLPDLVQVEAGEVAIRMLSDTYYRYPQRGVFRPWALFTPPSDPRAYRFVYPTLLVGSESGQELYLFDAPSATLTQTIPLPLAVEDRTQILYVELGPRHVFVCTMFEVLIIPRDASLYQDGTRDAVRSVSLRFPTEDPSMRIPQLVKHYASRIVEVSNPHRESAMKEYEIFTPSSRSDITSIVPTFGPPQEFHAVHVSEDGKNFAAVTWLGFVYFVRDFERVARGQATWSEVTLSLDMNVAATNLAFDHNRVVVTTHRGLYIFNWDLTFHNVLSLHRESPQPLPGLTLHQLMRFRDPIALRNVSCVKLTRTGIWIDWPRFALCDAEAGVGEVGNGSNDDLLIRSYLFGENPYAERVVYKIDFTPHCLLEGTS